MSPTADLGPGTTAVAAPTTPGTRPGTATATAPAGVTGMATGVLAIASITAIAVATARINRRVRALQELVVRYRHAARHDPLTGLPNRTVVLETLLGQTPELVGVLDLDDFKTVNDRYGHTVGDHLLRAVADRLGALLNASGTAVAGRLAGDEFAVLWICRPEDPFREAIRLLRTLAQPVTVDGRTLHPSVTLGLALASPSLSGMDLLAAADDALYYAKNHRRPVALYAGQEAE